LLARGIGIRIATDGVAVCAVVTVVVTVVVNELVDDEITVCAGRVSVVVNVTVWFAVTLATICSGHS
jgi:hypothetical protein